MSFSLGGRITARFGSGALDLAHDERRRPIADWLIQPNHPALRAWSGRVGRRRNLGVGNAGRLAGLGVDRLDRGNQRIRVRWNRDRTELEDLGLGIPDAPVVHEAVFDRAEADGDSADQAGLDRLPRLIEAILQRAGFVRFRDLGLEGDTLLGGLVELDRADRLVMLVLPEER